MSKSDNTVRVLVHGNLAGFPPEGTVTTVQRTARVAGLIAARRLSVQPDDSAPAEPAEQRPARTRRRPARAHQDSHDDGQDSHE